MYLNIKRRNPHWRLLLMLAILLILVGIFFGIQYFSKTTEKALNEQAASAIKSTVINRAIQCYVVEGVYPQSLSYLEDKYGLIINHKLFKVTYSAYASNLLPEVSVLRL